MIAATHNIFLVFASIAVSLVAAFTGLALTNNIAGQPENKRKALVVMSAFILGGGIWSMHFVAMLAHEFPIPVYYDSLQTLGSALIAILVVGVALLMLHFSARTPARLISAGLILGTGIVVMHYIGMLAIRGTVPEFSVWSVLLALCVAALAGIVAIRVAYGRRSRQNIVRGSVVFGCAVVAVHYAAMFGTRFSTDNTFKPVPVAMANHTLAIAVTVASFVICGTFLLAATTFLTQTTGSVNAEPDATSPDTPTDTTTPDTTKNEHPNPVTAISAHDSVASTTADQTLQIPFERNKKIEFADSSTVGAIRADGHYTHLYTKDGVRFCPWSITEAEKRLSDKNFHRTHRSYLVNIDEVHSFEKKKETGACLFEGYPQLSSVPVSRNRVLDLSRVLNSGQSAIGG